MKEIEEVIQIKKELIQIYRAKKIKQTKTAQSLLKNCEVYDRNISQLETDIKLLTSKIKTS